MFGNAQGWKCPHLSGHLIHVLMKKLPLMPCCQHISAQLPSLYLCNDPKQHHLPGPWLWSTWATPTDGQMLSLRQTDAAGGCMTTDRRVPVVLGVSAHPPCCRWPTKAGQGHVEAMSCLMNVCQVPDMGTGPGTPAAVRLQSFPWLWHSPFSPHHPCSNQRRAKARARGDGMYFKGENAVALFPLSSERKTISRSLPPNSPQGCGWPHPGHSLSSPC